MRQNVKKCLLIPLALAVSFNAVLAGCGEEGGGVSIDDVEFWSCYATTKVLQDRLDLYDADKQEAVVSLSAVRGEKEAAQLIMTTSDTAVKSYEVSVSDLSDGTHTFSAKNIVVYHEKYMELTGPNEYYTDPGYYPDCLVPFENVKSVGENVIPANSNQGLYIRFDIPQDQAPGVYVGQMTVTIGDGVKTIPVTLTVEQAAITEKTHVMSLFPNMWYLDRGELDTTSEMLEKYNEYLIDYRLGCGPLMVKGYSSEEELQRYAELACEYVQIPGCVNYSIDKTIGAVKESVLRENVDFDFDSIPDGDWAISGSDRVAEYVYVPGELYKRLKPIAYEGLKQGVDPFAKAIIFGYDEPNGTKGWKIQLSSTIVRQEKEKLAEELRNDASVADAALRNQIVESLLAMPHIVSASTWFDELDLETADYVYCPYFSTLDASSQREKYRLSEDNDLWWYGCCSPDYPYPTYHMDDTLLSARLESWMKADYNIQGNLYWATDYWYYQQSSTDKSGYLEDYYDYPIRSTNTAGEGFLLYPGKQYGIDGPLPSLRLEAIRDGLEEYEIMYHLDQAYDELNAKLGTDYDKSEIIRRIGGTMYSGTRVTTNDATFANARAQLVALANLALSDAQALITGVRDEADSIAFDIYVNDGYELTAGANHRVTSQQLDGGKLYTVKLKIGDADSFSISVAINGKTYSFAMETDSSATTYNAEYLLSKLSAYKTPCTLSLVDAIGEGTTGKYVKMNFTTKATDTQHMVVLKDDATIKKIGSTTDKLVLRFYNDQSTEVRFRLAFEYGSDAGIYSTYTDIYLTPGINTIVIENLYGVKWSKMKYINSIRFTIGQTGDDPFGGVYLVDMTIYNK